MRDRLQVVSKMAEQVVATAASSGSPNVRELDDTGSQEKPESLGYFVKEFFWDKIIIFLAGSIVGLSTLNILIELLKGSKGVECFIPDALNFSDQQAKFINVFCSRSVPDTQYLPFFILIHGVLIAACHYIWRSRFSSQFDLFFSLTNSLVRFREEDTGEYPNKNIRVVNRLETEFNTYRKTQIIVWYWIKMLFQLLIAIASILILYLLFNKFDVDFMCQLKNPSDGARTAIPCIFASLRLLFLVRILDTILLGLVVLAVVFTFIWLLVGHTDELDHRKMAMFSFCGGGINPEDYRPKPLLSVQGVSQLFSPRIKSDFDFLLLALYKTDSGLAHVFKECQIHKERERLTGAEVYSLVLVNEGMLLIKASLFQTTVCLPIMSM